MTDAAGARRWTLALVGITAVWGSTFVVVQEAVDRLPVFVFNGWRFAIATVVLAAVALPGRTRLTRRGLVHGCVLGVLLWIGYTSQTFALTLTTAPKVGFITGMFVVFTPLLQAAFLRRPPSRAALVGAGLATAGLALLTLEGALLPRVGDALVLVTAFAFALHIVGLGAWSAQHPPAALATVQLAVGALLHTLGAAIQAMGGGDGPWAPRGAYVWAAVVFTAVFASALAFVVQTAAQRVLTPTRAAVIMTMEPVFSWLTSWAIVPVLVAMGVAGLDAQAFGPRQAAGAALILAGMLWSELRAASVSSTADQPSATISEIARSS